MTEECYAGSDNTDSYVVRETKRQTPMPFTNQVSAFTEFLPMLISINIEVRAEKAQWHLNIKCRHQFVEGVYATGNRVVMSFSGDC